MKKVSKKKPLPAWLVDFVKSFDEGYQKQIEALIRQMSSSELSSLRAQLESKSYSELRELKARFLEMLADDPDVNADEVVEELSEDEKDADFVESLTSNLPTMTAITYDFSKIDVPDFTLPPTCEDVKQIMLEYLRSENAKEAPALGLGARIEDVILEAPHGVTPQEWEQLFECFYKDAKPEYFNFRVPNNQTGLKSVEPEYNFYIENYESIDINERVLPNLYSFYFLEKQQREDHLGNEDYFDLITLKNRIKYDVSKPKGQYFDKYIKVISRLRAKDEGDIKKISKQYSNLIFSEGSL